MIRPQELRIGNWVIVEPFTYKAGKTTISNESSQLCQITSIQKVGDSVILQVNNNITAPIPIENVSGVPLCEEMFDNSGFLRSSNELGNSFHVMDRKQRVIKYTIEHWTNTNSKIYETGFYADRVGRVKYVHQVQNVLSYMCGIDFDFSCLNLFEVISHFEEGSTTPFATQIIMSNK